MPHWADLLAAELLERGQQHVLATGITPSGPIHVGNMREVLTTEAVHRAVKDAGGRSRFIYVGDTYDPLRKVYPFLDASYKAHVGKPLSEIPCPCGSHPSYAHHFLEPFLAALDELGVEREVRLAHEMYGSGAYADSIVRAMEATPRIKAILERVSGRALPADWIPFNVRCARCGTIHGTTPHLYEFPDVEYRCACGETGRVDIRRPGAGKLPWRVDWPARWAFLGVTFEAFGKDHAAAGSSWDTAVPIARDVFGIEPPHHTVYEFVLVKGKGAMHSSTGLAVSATEMLAMTPPEVLRFLMVRSEPRKHIEFDPGMGLLDLVDEYDRWLGSHLKGAPTADMKEPDRVLWLAQPSGRLPGHAPPAVPYRHLATLAQLAPDDDVALAALGRGGFVGPEPPPEDRAHLVSRLAHVRAWLGRFAPDDVRFDVQVRLPDAARAAPGAAALAVLAETLDATDWGAEALHNAVYEAATKAGVPSKAVFEATYLALLGKPRGPRFGHFAALLERGFVLQRLREASGAGR